MTTNQKAPKKQGPIRWGAIIPLVVIIVLTGLYFKLFFDTHLRLALEYAGYRAVGAEVNIGSLKTSFINANLRIQDVQVTNAAEPKTNSISIGDIRFGMSWDALLRAKILINEVAVEKIEFGKPRKSPGRVLPPEPVVVVAPGEEEPSKIKKAAEELKDKALAKTQENYENNVLGDIASLLSGTDADTQAGKIEASLESKKLAQNLENELKAKTQSWQKRIKELPQGKDFQALTDRLSKVKVNNIKNADELQKSLREIESIFKEADQKFKEIQSASNDLNQDLTQSQKDIANLDAQIKNDIKALESRFNIPRLDPKNIAQAMFRQYLDPYLAKFNHYRQQAEKYVPPNLMKKGNPEEPEVSIQPRPREDGVVYEFGRAKSYPAFWIKNVSVSSQAGMSPYAGNIRGQIMDITSNQVLVGKPTVAKFAGDFPSAELRGIDTQLIIDNRKENSLITMDFALASFPLIAKSLVNSSDVKIAFEKASGGMKLQSELLALKDFKFDLQNRFTDITYKVEASNSQADEILGKIFNDIPMVTLNAKGWGNLPALALSVDSNLGQEIVKGVQKQIQAKIAEARAQIEKYVNEQVGAHKAQIEAQYAQIKNQVEGELKKLQNQADAQKKQAEAKSEAAKKDAENQGKKKLEDEAKKAAEDLKKKFGF